MDKKLVRCKYQKGKVIICKLLHSHTIYYWKLYIMRFHPTLSTTSKHVNNILQ